jgi:hypothetical protein
MELSQASEAALWAALRALEEKAAMQRRIAEGMGSNLTSMARLRDQSDSDDAHARVLRDMIFARDAQLHQGTDSYAEKTAEKISPSWISSSCNSCRPAFNCRASASVGVIFFSIPTMVS